MINQQEISISKFDAWILASRPKTLPAAIMPVLVGSAIAIHDNKFKALAAIIALICSLLIQIGTNLVNDLYDYLKGTDKKERLGPQRAAASGLLSIKELKIGIYVVFGLSFLLGIYLIAIAGWLVLLIGVLSIIAGVIYTAGPFPLAYNALGDIASFLFFGFIGTIGTYYVQANEITAFVFWASIPVGSLITNILVVNNYRDKDEDKLNGKKTLAVLFGEKFARIQYIIFMIASYSILFVVFFTFKKSVWVFLPILSLPISVKLIKMIYTFKGRELNKTLELTAKLSAIYGLLFAFGILI